MRILFITPRTPYPPLRGDQTRAYHLIRHLSQRHDVTVLIPTQPKPIPEEHQTQKRLNARFIHIPSNRLGYAKSLLNSITEGWPLQTALFSPPDLIAGVQDLLEKETFDLVHLHTARMAPLLQILKGLPRVIDFIDALSLNLQQRAQIAPWPLKGLLLMEAVRMKRLEEKLIGDTDGQVVTSRRDKEALGGYPTIHVIPNGVDIPSLTPRNSGKLSEGKIIIFSGRMGYPPNAEAAILFSRNIWPKILQREPSAQLWIVGADPPRRVLNLSKLPNVKVTGYVPHIGDYLAQATVAVAPIRRGTGIQNKILEAMAAGTPVVTTPIGAGGIEATPGEHLLVAKNDEEFVEQVVALLRDPSLRADLAKRALELIQEKYTWEKVTSLLEKVYLTITRTKPNKP